MEDFPGRAVPEQPAGNGPFRPAWSGDRASGACGAIAVLQDGVLTIFITADVSVIFFCQNICSCYLMGYFLLCVSNKALWDGGPKYLCLMAGAQSALSELSTHSSIFCRFRQSSWGRRNDFRRSHKFSVCGDSGPPSVLTTPP